VGEGRLVKAKHEEASMNWNNFLDCFPGFHKQDVAHLLEVVQDRHARPEDVPDRCDCGSCKALRAFADLSASWFQTKINNSKFAGRKPEEWLAADKETIREWVAGRTVGIDRLNTFVLHVSRLDVGGRTCLVLLPLIPYGHFDFDGFLLGFADGAAREEFVLALKSQLDRFGVSICKEEEYWLPRARSKSPEAARGENMIGGDQSANGGRAPSLPARYDIVRQACPFTCNYAVYGRGRWSSLCYATDEVRADLIASALALFAASPEGAEWAAREEAGKLRPRVLRK
jgi:hypothetical protein